MTLDQFVATLNDGEPPAGLSPCLDAMWYEKRGDWDRAHKIVQDIDSETASHVHAYLHRREGDQSNAGYWYRRAGRPFPSGLSLDLEWSDLTAELLSRS